MLTKRSSPVPCLHPTRSPPNLRVTAADGQLELLLDLWFCVYNTEIDGALLDFLVFLCLLDSVIFDLYNKHLR